MKKSKVKKVKLKKGIRVKSPESLKIEPVIKSTLKIVGRTYTAEGKTIEEAATNLKPEVTKAVGVLVLEKGDVRKEKILPARLIYLLFNKVSRMSKELAIKQLNMYFDRKLFE